MSSGPNPIPQTPEELRALARRQLLAEPGETVFDPKHPVVRGDHDLNPGKFPGFGEPLISRQLKPAAVLVPIVARADGLTVLMTERSADLPSHAGQVAFPGGKMDATDRTPLDTALREAEEEIGLARAHVEPIGYLDVYQTGTGFRIVPAVALVEPSFTLSLNRGEVADAFEVPLAFLLDAANHQRQSTLWRGRMTYYFAMPYGERYIWGATAGMVRNLTERLIAPC